MNTFETAIRSQDRMSGTPEDYTVALPHGVDMSQFSKFYCSSVAMRGSRYNINASNNIFYCDHALYDNTAGTINHNVFGVPVPLGSYSPRELGEWLQTGISQYMVNNSIGSDPLTLNVDYDDITGKFKINVTSSEHRGLPQASEHVWFMVCDSTALFSGEYTWKGSLNQALGFETMTHPPVTPGGFTSYINAATSEFQANCMQTFTNLPRLLLCCDLCTSGIVSTNRDYDTRQGLALVIEPPFGSVAVWESGAHRIEHSVQGRTFQSMRVFWVDIDSGERVDFNCVDHTLSIRFE